MIPYEPICLKKPFGAVDVASNLCGISGAKVWDRRIKVPKSLRTVRLYVVLNQLLVKAFSGLIELLTIATKDQLFQFNGELYEQSEGVAMGSPLGPLMANTFMCSLEEQLKLRGKLSSYYKRYVDDTLTVMKDEVSAYSFLHVLNDLHSSISFTMELPTENTLPFLGMVLRKDSQRMTTSV